MIVTDCNISDLVPALPVLPDMTARFSENSLLIAVNLLTEKCVRELGRTPNAIRIYVAPFCAFIAESVLKYPQGLQTLHLIHDGVLGEIAICENMPGDEPNLPWAIKADSSVENLLITSNGTTAPPPFKPEILYNR